MQHGSTGSPERHPDAGGMAEQQGPVARGQNPAPARSQTSLPAALRELVGVPGQGCTGKLPAPPACSQPLLASGKEKGAFPRPDPSFRPRSPQRCREVSLCSPCVTGTSSPWECTSPCSTDRETETQGGTKVPTGS